MNYIDFAKEEIIKFRGKNELSACREILQKLILKSLTKTDFFQKSAFMGGTCLRIFHNSKRFSEDLDFSLQNIDLDFDLQHI